MLSSYSSNAFVLGNYKKKSLHFYVANSLGKRDEFKLGSESYLLLFVLYTGSVISFFFQVEQNSISF